MTIEYVWRPNPNMNESQYPNTNFSDKLALMADPRFGNMVPVTVLGSDARDVVEEEKLRFADLETIRNSQAARLLTR